MFKAINVLCWKVIFNRKHACNKVRRSENAIICRKFFVNWKCYPLDPHSGELIFRKIVQRGRNERTTHRKIVSAYRKNPLEYRMVVLANDFSYKEWCSATNKWADIEMVQGEEKIYKSIGTMMDPNESVNYSQNFLNH